MRLFNLATPLAFSSLVHCTAVRAFPNAPHSTSPPAAGVLSVTETLAFPPISGQI